MNDWTTFYVIQNMRNETNYKYMWCNLEIIQHAKSFKNTPIMFDLE